MALRKFYLAQFFYFCIFNNSKSSTTVVSVHSLSALR